MKFARKAVENVVSILRWVGQAKLIWKCATGVVGCFIVSLGLEWAYDLEWISLVRIFGLLLQWLGLGAVALGIAETRKLFGKPSLWERFLSWLKSFPCRQTRVIVGTGGLHLSGSAGFARGHVTSQVGPNATLEERLSVVEKSIVQLRADLRESDRLANEQIQKVQSSIEAKTAELSAADRRTMSLLESFSVGGIDLEFAGLVWLIAGVTAGTIPDEILGIIHFVCSKCC